VPGRFLLVAFAVACAPAVEVPIEDVSDTSVELTLYAGAIDHEK